MTITVTGTLRDMTGVPLSYGVVHFRPVLQSSAVNRSPSSTTYFRNTVSFGADEAGHFEAVLESQSENTSLHSTNPYIAEIYHETLLKMIRFRLVATPGSTIDLSTQEILSSEQFKYLLQHYKIGKW